MANQASLINELLALMQKVDGIKGEERREERVKASTAVETELASIEARLKAIGVPGTAEYQQQMGLISLVRSALQSDREGGSLTGEEEWSDEGLLKTHGVATYAAQSYWDQAYSSGRYGASFDWYGGWADPDTRGTSLAQLVRPVLPKDARILVLGCGNSNLSSDILDEGVGEVVSVDISEPVIQQMRETFGGRKGMQWHAMDAGALQFADDSFDFAIEKGLFDALYAGTGSHVGAVLAEARRVLKPKGRLISVSFSGDRIEKLFHRQDEDQPSAAAAATLSCGLAGELQYKEKAADAEKAKQGFFVYSCEEPA